MHLQSGSLQAHDGNVGVYVHEYSMSECVCQ